MNRLSLLRRNFHLVIFLFTIGAQNAVAITKTPLVPPDMRSEYQCQMPMRLFDFIRSIEHKNAQRSIHWNIRSLIPSAQTRVRLIQISEGAVSPVAAFLMPIGQSHYELPLRPLTMERNWLEALRGTDAIDELHPAQQMVMWINELYHLFVIDSAATKNILPNDPFLPALLPGAYVFTNDKMAFTVSKDHNFLTICPRISDNGKVVLSAKEIMTEVGRFVQDPRIIRFFSCESLLTRYKI
jgi:hypothetical protein